MEAESVAQMSIMPQGSQLTETREITPYKSVHLDVDFNRVASLATGARRINVF